MERRSTQHGPRLDDALEREVESITRGAPVESRSAPARRMEDAADDEPIVEGIIQTVDTDAGDSGMLSRTDVRRRSDLAVHLRPSIFPASRAEIIACAREEDAPVNLIWALEGLPSGVAFETTEEIWEALGGRHEERAPAPRPAQRFGFKFDRLHRVLGLAFGVTPSTTHVDVDPAAGRLVARFGPWVVDTSLANVKAATRTGGYFPLKTVGPAHLSLSDRGLTFATNDAEGVCVAFREPVHGIDPRGVVRHPALTVTVEDVDGLLDVLR